MQVVPPGNRGTGLCAGGTIAHASAPASPGTDVRRSDLTEGRNRYRQSVPAAVTVSAVTGPAGPRFRRVLAGGAPVVPSVPQAPARPRGPTARGGLPAVTGR